MNSLFFLITSLFYSILLVTVYFYKQRLHSVENKIFKYLIVTNLIGLILDISCIFTVSNMDVFPALNAIVTKAYLVYLHVWISLLTTYIFVISFKKDNETFKKIVKTHPHIFKGFFAFVIISFMLILALPLYYFSEGGRVYSYGPSANVSYMVAGICVITWLISMLYNIKNIRNKKYAPMFVFMIIGTVVIIVQKLNPTLLLMTSMETFVTFLMYFTIENPDIRMIEELNKAKNLSEKYNNDKSIFLFNFTQQIKPALSNMAKLSKDSIKEDKIDFIKENLLTINEQSERILNTLNNVFDVSQMDSNKLKVIENEYKVNLLLNEVILKNKKLIEEKGIEFRVNLDEGLPDALYGDYIKIKQVLNALLSNSIKYTEKGFIELTVNSIVKYDVCRLIINIEDSGIGIKTEELDKLFIKDEEEEEFNFDDNDIKLDVIKRMVNVIGGTIMVKSSKKEGTKFTVVLDQRIVEDENNKTLEDFERYKKIQLEKLNIMIVDDEEKNLEMLAKKLSSDKVQIVTVNGGQLCLEKIRNKEKYDLILIDDVLNKLSTGDTEKKLKQIKDFNTPIVVISDSNDPVTRSMYLQTGFSGILTKPVKKKDFEKLIEELMNDKAKE